MHSGWRRPRAPKNPHLPSYKRLSCSGGLLLLTISVVLVTVLNRVFLLDFDLWESWGGDSTYATSLDTVAKTKHVVMRRKLRTVGISRTYYAVW
jgi:hypothetical protein